MPERDKSTVLEVVGVSKHFGGLTAVDEASLEIDDRSVTALIGPNGAGKTTLFNIISGFYRRESGRISFRGQPVEGKSPYAIARLGLVRTFQITKALTKMSVLDNMMMAAPKQPGESFWNLWSRPRKIQKREREVAEQSRELLETFELQRMANEYAGTLSGGQRKLLELARALMTEPTTVLLDEPMAGVNPALAERLLGHIERLRKEEGKAFFFIEHNMEVVMNYSDRVIVMAEGKVIADGLPDEVRADRRVIDAYLGAEA